MKSIPGTFSDRAEETMASSHSWGLLSIGASGDWQIDIDEPVDSNETLFAVTLQHPNIYVLFHITSLSVIDRLIDFLDTMNSTNFKFEIEGCLGGSLLFIFDEGRIFIRSTSTGRLGEMELFEVRVNDADAKSLAKALKDAVESI